MPAIDACVIVPTYNRAEYLPECLRSLLAQTVAPVRIVVVDDGSTDATRDVVAGFSPRVEYRHQDNAGKAAALNHALRLVRNDLIWIFDDDDIASPDALAVLSDALFAQPDAGFAFGHFDRFTHSVNDTVAADDQHFDRDAFHVRQALRCTVFQPAMLVRRACYDAVGPFDETLPRAQDYDMLLRLARAYPAAYVDRVVFHQRQHTGTRGPAHMRIDGVEVWDRQLAFDARVLRKVHERGDPRDFLPRSEVASPLTPEKTVRALITRAAALGRRRLWNLAGNDVAEALAIAGRESIAKLPDPIVATLSDAYRAEGIADRREAAPSELDVVRAHPETPLRRQLLDELSWVDLSRIGRSASRGQWRAARHHAANYLRATRGALLLRHVERLARRMRRD